MSAAVAGGVGCKRATCAGTNHVVTARGAVDECVTEEDAAAVAAVRRQLATELGGSATEIQVSASAGVVTLKGHVDDERQMRLAEKLAYGADGVEHVENRLFVLRPPANPRAMP